jgi:hypothetical protein
MTLANIPPGGWAISIYAPLSSTRGFSYRTQRDKNVGKFSMVPRPIIVSWSHCPKYALAIQGLTIVVNNANGFTLTFSENLSGILP